jgi:hypothetical protein
MRMIGPAATAPAVFSTKGVHSVRLVRDWLRKVAEEADPLVVLVLDLWWVGH